MNALATTENTSIATMTEPELIKVLQSSLYPGAAIESIKMVLGYCRAAGLDPFQKPVHIVPMWDSKAGAMRDVIMPGVGLYRTQASRTGRFAGQTEPEFGPMITETIGGQSITYPEWARVTVKKQLDNGDIAEFSAKEFWIENYAVKGGKEKSAAPNSMWARRPRGQIGKCAGAQALRLAFPEMGAQPTAEEMEGKPMLADDQQPPAFDYLDPAPLIAGVDALTTDAEAAAYWKEHNAKLAKQPADHQALKDAVIERRTSLKTQLGKTPARTNETDKPVITFAIVMERLIRAKNLDALDVAIDWAAEVADANHRAELSEKYSTLRAAMEAA